MKNIINKNGFSEIIPLLIIIGIILASSGTYLLTKPKNPQSTNQPSQQLSLPSSEQEQLENKSLSNDLLLELKLSSLSSTKGKVDIYWGKSDGLISGKPEEAIAAPLDLVDGIKIINNTNKKILLTEINNESQELLKVIPKTQEITEGPKITEDQKIIENQKITYGKIPIVLLPEKFIKNDKEEIVCKGRDIFASSLNNICVFETPLIIAPKETVTLKPQLFAIPQTEVIPPPYNRETITFLDEKNKDRNSLFVFVTIPKNGKKYLFLSNQFFSIGGFILVNSKDENFINKVFNFKTSDGDKINAKVNSVISGIKIKSFSLPEKGFEAEKNKFNENVLTAQVFLYRNNFLNQQDISGEYDDNTIIAIKRLQRKAGLVETGKFDDATIFVTRAFDTGIFFYENYGDEEVTVSFDTQQPYFRLFSIGTRKVSLNEDFSPSSIIVKLVKKINCSESYCGHYAYTLNNREIFTLDGITILNNTPQIKKCSLINPRNIIVKNFSINPNNMYSLRVALEGLTTSTMHRLQCEGKVMDIEMVPEVKNRAGG